MSATRHYARSPRRRLRLSRRPGYRPGSGAAPRRRCRRASGSSPAWLSEIMRAETGRLGRGQSTMTSRTIRGSMAATPGIVVSARRSTAARASRLRRFAGNARRHKNGSRPDCSELYVDIEATKTATPAATTSAMLITCPRKAAMSRHSLRSSRLTSATPRARGGARFAPRRLCARRRGARPGRPSQQWRHYA